MSVVVCLAEDILANALGMYYVTTRLGFKKANRAVSMDAPDAESHLFAKGRSNASAMNIAT